MIRTPTFGLAYRVNVAPGTGVFFMSEAGEFVISGPVAETVAAMIDGSRTADQIVAAAAATCEEASVRGLLGELERQRIVFEAPASGDVAEQPFWNCLGADLAAVAGRLAAASVAVLDLSDGKAAAELADALTAYGVRVDGGGDVSLVVCDDYLDPRIDLMNRARITDGRSWMLLKPGGLLPMIGPIIRPGRTACWECLAHRLRGRRASETYFASAGGVSLAQPIKAHLLNHNGLPALAAVQAAKWIALGVNNQLDGRLVTLEPLSLAIGTHRVVRRPQCPACGVPEEEPPPPTLDFRGKSGATSHRSLTPAETYARCEHHVSPICGLVRSVAPLHGAGDEIVKLALATHNFALDSSSPALLKHSLESQSCGKGITEAQARTGALIEALERYSGKFQGNEPRIRASFRSLGAEAIHPNAVMLYSERQYARRDTWNALGSPFMFVPAPFDESAEIEWTPVWSFGQAGFRYLPTALLYYGYPALPGSASCWADSNGSAAGNSLEEAIVHGFLEIAERDAVAMWWYNRLRMPSVDLDSFADAYVDRCRDHYAKIGRELWVLDVSNDFGIPVFVAISRRYDRTPEEIIMGFGAHLDAHAALIGALTEMNQFLPAVSAPLDSSGHRLYAYRDAQAISWWRTARVADQSYLLPQAGAPVRRAEHYPTQASRDHLWDVTTCITRAQGLGLDTMLLDQSRPDIEVNVAKVIVPGARHFWARLAPGRLFDVPVALGRLPRRVTEDELNPIAMFL